MMRFCFLLYCSLLPNLVLANEDGTEVLVRNDSVSAKVSWVNPNTGERVFMVDLDKDAQARLNSFLGHEFELEETGSCEKDDMCMVTTFKVSQEVVQSIILDKNFRVVEGVNSLESVANEEMNPENMLPLCKEQAMKRLETLVQNDLNGRKSVLEELKECLKETFAPVIQRKGQEIEFERKIREDMAWKMENFTCTNPNLESSADVDTREWKSEKDGKTRVVHVKLDRPSSRIHVIEDFAYPEECDAMEEVAKPRLGPASTADGKGGSQISKSRKALQAGISPQWHKESEGDLVTRLSRRVYDYVNWELGLNLEHHGQEQLMSIQYFGRGYNDTEPDRYTPHCDGGCEGLPHVPGARMATMVIYCKIPEKGGHTNFQNANVHVKPEVRNAIFFSYIDPATNLTDTYLTQHSGCPVFEGEKKIITQWVRYGVSKQTPHYSFNTLGVLRSESGE